MLEQYTTTIPFSGFGHDSQHENNIMFELQQIQENFEYTTGRDFPQSLNDIINSISYVPIYDAYAKGFCESLLDKIDLKGKYDERQDDRVFANFSPETVFKLLWETDVAMMDKQAKESFTSYDGFSSFYASDWRKWGSLDEWDHNQIGCLLQAWLLTHHVSTTTDFQNLESETMEGLLGNGFIDECLYKSKDCQRVMNIEFYLCERSKRKDA